MDFLTDLTYLISTIYLKTKDVRRPGIEPGSTAWKATMLTFTPPTQLRTIEILTYFIYSVPKLKGSGLR